VRVLCTHPKDPSLAELPPEGAWDYLTELERLLDSSIDSVSVACPFFDDTGIEILSAANRRSGHKPRWEIFTRRHSPERLKSVARELGWGLYEYMGTPGGEEERGFHCKLIVVDERRAILGSANLFYANLVENLEIGVLLDEAGEVLPLVKVLRALKRASRRVS